MAFQTSQNDPKTTPKATPNAPHKIRLFLRIVSFRYVPLIFLGYMLSPSWVYVGYVGLVFAYFVFMLVYVGSGWVTLAHVG